MPHSSNPISQKISSRVATLKADLNSLENNTGHGLPVTSDTSDGSTDTLGKAKAHIQVLEDDLSRRQESYIRRERGYKTQIEDLEAEIKRLKGERTSWMNTDDSMINLRSLHSKVVENIGQVNTRIKTLLVEQERDLLRAFRARLFDVQSELEKEKNRSNDGAGVWIDKTRHLEKDLEWARQMADRLQRVNQTLSRENNRLKGQFKTQEEDREFLIRQLVAVKKENVRIRGEAEEYASKLKEMNDRFASVGFDGTSIQSGPSATGVASGNANNGGKSGARASTAPGKARERRRSGKLPQVRRSESGNQKDHQVVDQEHRYREIVKRLKRLLDTERNNVRKLRNEFTRDLQQRTEMEALLRSVMRQVKNSIAERRTKRYLLGPDGSTSQTSPQFDSEGMEPTPTSSQATGAHAKVQTAQDIAIEDFTEKDQETVLELLLSKERVIALLYGKVFPNKPDLLKRKSLTSNNSTMFKSVSCTDFIQFPSFSKEEIESIYQSKTNRHQEEMI